jgi:uncharacterized protein
MNRTLSPQSIVAQTADHVRGLLSGDSSGHDWWHIARVRALALNIGRQEGADLFVVELAALLHDIADWKFHAGDDTLGPRRARQWLAGLEVEPAVVDDVSEIIATLSYKGAGVPTPMRTLEGRVVQDADRLDAIGAIGIARTFAYGGHAGQPLHEPDLEPQTHATFADYQRSRTTTINHFHEKLLLLKDRLLTKTARELAQGRHEFMEAFLAQFDDEWAGRK